MKRLALASIACLAVGWIACSPAAEEADESNGAVVGGDLDDATPAIGFLGYAGSPNVPFCTGTLIAPDVVLTAAHCVDAYESARAKNASLDEYVFGVGRVDRSKAYPIASVKRHPSWVRALTNFDCSTTCVFQHDIAYVVLAKPVEKIAPLKVQRTAHVGSCEYIATGYGISRDGYGSATAPKLADGDLGQRRSVGLCVQSKLVDGMIQVKSDEGAICNGDSGGPLRRRGTTDLVGTVSYRLRREACTAGATAYYTPVITNLPFIDEALAASRYRSTEPKPDGGAPDASIDDAGTDGSIAIDAGPTDAGADATATPDAGDAGAPTENDAGTTTGEPEPGETSELPPSEGSTGSSRADGSEDAEDGAKTSKAGATESSGCAASNGKAPTSDLAGALVGLSLLLGLRRSRRR